MPIGSATFGAGSKPSFQGGSSSLKDRSMTSFGSIGPITNGSSGLNIGELLKPLSAPTNTGGAGLQVQSRLNSNSAITAGSTFSHTAVTAIAVGAALFLGFMIYKKVTG